MDRVNFEPGDEPEILTSVSPECQRGNCEDCPGHARLPEAGGELVFCVHECHEAKPAN